MCCNCNCSCGWNAHPCMPRNHGKWWSAQERRQARRHYMAGHSLGRIARDLGRSRSSIQMELGLY